MCVQKEKISIFTSEEKFAQAFSYAGMQRGRTASFLHFTHAGVKNQEQMALQPSLRNLRHTLLWQCIELLQVDRDPECLRDLALSK